MKQNCKHESSQIFSVSLTFFFLSLSLFPKRGQFLFTARLRSPIVRVNNLISRLHWEVPRLKSHLPKTIRAQVAQIKKDARKTDIIFSWHRWCTLNRGGFLRLGIPKEDLPLSQSAAKHWSLVNVSDLLYIFCGPCEIAATWHHTTDKILHARRFTAPSHI